MPKMEHVYGPSCSRSLLLALFTEEPREVYRFLQLPGFFYADTIREIELSLKKNQEQEEIHSQ